MSEQKPEQKFIELTEFKSSDENSGSFEGYANNFGVLDSYDDITLPGCSKDCLPEFLQSGFTAPDHRWGIASEIGIPMEAFEDAVGIYIKSIYHPTPDAQQIRQKVNNRLANGKKVSLSIGYWTLEKEYVVGEEAAPFLNNPSQNVLNYLKEKQPLVRLLRKIKLMEHSIVPRGANSDSAVSEGKSSIVDKEQIQAERKKLLDAGELRRIGADEGGNIAKKLQTLNLKLRMISA